MLDCQEDILSELGTTLDLLVQNAGLLKQKNLCILSDREIDLLHKTQESLVAKFFHTKEHLISKAKERRKDLEEKIQKLQDLNLSLLEGFPEKLRKSPTIGLARIGRNRKRSKRSEFPYSNF